MSDFVYFNGEYKRFGEAAIPLGDRAIYFGDGCYDVLLARRGKIYQFEEHFSRLKNNCERLKIPFHSDGRQMRSVIYRLCDISCLEDAVIYIQISRRGGRRRHEIEEKYGADVLVTVSGFELGDPIHLSAITVEDRRHLMCDIKTVNLLCSVLALAEANEVGCDCAIFLRDGVVTEESRSNVFILNDGKLITHPTDRKILPGIMRANLIALADRLGMAVEEREFGADELYSADEVFVSSTTKFLRRIKSIDGQKCKMAENEIYRQLYRGLVNDFLQKTE